MSTPEQALLEAIHDVCDHGGTDIAAHGASLARSFAAAAITATDLLVAPLDAINGRIAASRIPAPTMSGHLLLELQRAVRRRRLDVGSPCDTGPGRQLVFTAPHTLELERDGHPFHLMESYTGTLAIRFAEAVRGAGYVTWGEAERKRVRIVTRMEGKPDASNRDPNFLLNAELADSVWYTALQAARMRIGSPRCLHVDLHGMSDSHGVPHGGADCILGLGAMGRRRGEAASAVFRAALAAELGPQLEQAGMRLVSTGPELQGDWGPDRNTLTQMATDPVLWATASPFSHAVQIEMTIRLRKHLDKNPAARAGFAHAILRAFQRAGGASL